MQINNPPTNTLPILLISNLTGIDANSIAISTLNYQNSASAANSIPLFARVTRRSGTLTLLAFTIRLNGIAMKPVIAATVALLGSSSNPLIFPLNSDISTATLPLVGNYDVSVTSLNGVSSTFDIEIYGLKIS